MSTVDVDVVDAPCVVVEQRVNVVDRHTVDEYQRGQKTVEVFLFPTNDEPWYAIDGCFFDIEHIFNEHFVDGVELAVLVEVVRQVGFDAKHLWVIV